MSSEIRLRSHASAVLPDTTPSEAARPIPSRRADLFAHHFAWPADHAQPRIAYGNNARVEYRVSSAVSPPAPVAVKLQSSSKHSLRELQLLQAAQSPHVIALHEAFYIEPQQSGLELAFVMPAALPLPQAWPHWTTPAAAHARTQGLAHDLFAAVDFLHTLGIFHRDIKASNILMHDNRAVLGDFGEAFRHPSRPFAQLYRWADVRDSAALLIEVMARTNAPASATHLERWMTSQAGTLSTDAVRAAFAAALEARDAAPSAAPAHLASRIYQFWRVVQLVEKEVDSVRKKGLVMTVRQSMPQWNAAAYDRRTRPWAYADAPPQT